jgi:hypothetical protein
MSVPKARRRTIRLGNRERSRLQMAVIVIICGMLMIVLWPIFMDFIEQRNFQVCQSNMLHIATGIQTYTHDWDDTLPLAASWTDACASHMAGTSGTGKDADSYLKCPIDNTGKHCSYAYNSAMEGISLTVRPADDEAMSRRKRFGRIDRAPLIIEKHGVERNASIDLVDWNAVIKNLDMPHKRPAPTGSLIRGDLNPWWQNREQLDLVAGKGF